MRLRNILQEKMRELGPDVYKRFLCQDMIYHWDKIVDENISTKIRPINIEHGILFVDVENSALKDQLKFFEEDILEAINKKYAKEEPFVKEIRIASSAQIAAAVLPKKKPQPKVPAQEEFKPEDIILSQEDIKHCEELAGKLSNEELRQTVFQSLLKQTKFQKFRLANGWHKCSKCNALCSPEELFCEVCRIKEHEIMVKKLFKIFYEEPYLKPWEAQKILLEKMPHMKDECSLAVVESARTSLIQNVARSVQYGDEESLDVLKLVALEKRLPLDKLTPAIIRRTLIELQYNLSGQSKLQRYFIFKDKQ